MIKLILCDGDSWTAGDMIDPTIDTTNVNDERNDDYRLSKLWPNDLEKLSNIPVLNIARAGSSNDGVCRRIIDNINYFLEEELYSPEELFVIVGWSSPERKDFYYTSIEHTGWETLYPSFFECTINTKKDIQDFYKTYIQYFWNQAEFITRHIQQNYLLHYFLKDKNIKHIFFNAFYECKFDLEKTPYEMSVDNDFVGIFYKSDLMDDLTGQASINKSTVKNFSKLYDQIFIKGSFRNHIMTLMENGHDNLFEPDQHHPNREGHKIWANVVYNHIKDVI